MIIGIDGNEANIKDRVGSNQYAFELIKALSALKSEHKWVVYLASPPSADLPKKRENWSYRVIGPGQFWTQWRLPFDLFFHKPRPDIFFSPGHYTPRFSPIPIVASIMDLGYLRFPQQFKKRDLWQLKFWTAYSIKKTKHLLAISQSTKDEIIKEYGIKEEKITVTYPGSDKANFNLKIKEDEKVGVRKKYKIPGDYLLFLSTLKPSKNVEGLLEAFKQIAEENSSLSLVIAGKKGWLYETIFSQVKSLGLGEKVIFTDFVPDEDLPGLVGGAKVFILPSFWEGFGIPVVEAMACGVPVVVSGRGSLPEVVGEAGVVVDPQKPEDIARGVKKAIEQGEDLTRKGLIQASKFSWEKCARETLKALEKLV